MNDQSKRYKKQIDEINVNTGLNIREIERQAEIDTRVLRRKYNESLKKESVHTDEGIIRNYEMGLITLEECLIQRIEILQSLLKGIYCNELVK
jgi:hypothetical protein